MTRQLALCGSRTFSIQLSAPPPFKLRLFDQPAWWRYIFYFRVFFIITFRFHLLVSCWCSGSSRLTRRGFLTDCHEEHPLWLLAFPIVCLAGSSSSSCQRPSRPPHIFERLSEYVVEVAGDSVSAVGSVSRGRDPSSCCPFSFSASLLCKTPLCRESRHLTFCPGILPPFLWVCIYTNIVVFNFQTFRNQIFCSYFCPHNVLLKVFTRSDAVGGVVRQKWKSIYRAPEDISDTMGRYFFHFCDSSLYHPDDCVVGRIGW